MKILNLYAGIGGNRKLWENVEVTAVEINHEIAATYKQLYPQDTVVVADAHQYLLDHYQEFDFIWSSPPCPTHSRMRRTSLVKSKPVYPDMTLYQEVIFLKHFFKGIWIVENVIPYYVPLISPALVVDRHMFWSGVPIRTFAHFRNYTGRVTVQSKETLAREYGIELPEETKNQRQLLRNAVNPDIGLAILEATLKVTGQSATDLLQGDDVKEIAP